MTDSCFILHLQEGEFSLFQRVTLKLFLFAADGSVLAQSLTLEAGAKVPC